MNYIKGVKEKTGLPSPTFAKSFLAKLLDGNEELTSFSNVANGVTSIGLRVKNQKIDRIIHYFVVADETNDTVRIIMFESPIKDWDSAWAIGEPMFRNLILVFPKDSPSGRK